MKVTRGSISLLVLISCIHFGLTKENNVADLLKSLNDTFHQSLHEIKADIKKLETLSESEGKSNSNDNIKCQGDPDRPSDVGKITLEIVEFVSLRPGVLRTIPFKIHNAGSGSYCTVFVSPLPEVTAEVHPARLYVDSGDGVPATLIMNISSRAAPRYDSLTITVQSESEWQTHGYAILSLLILPPDMTPPVCTVRGPQKSSCTDSMTKDSCKDGAWLTPLAIQDEESGISKISKISPHVTLTFDSFLPGSTGVVTATVGSSCCVEDITVTTVNQIGIESFCQVMLQTDWIPKFGVEIDAEHEDELSQILEGVHSWGCDTIRLSELTTYPLTVTAYRIFEDRGLLEAFNISHQRFISFMKNAEKNYRSNIPFHNSLHAADVMQSTNALLNLPSLKSVFRQEEIFSALLSASLHDVDHDGSFRMCLANRSAGYQKNPLEHHHLEVGFQLLKDPQQGIWESFTAPQAEMLRGMISELIHGTNVERHDHLLEDLQIILENKRRAGSLMLDYCGDRMTVLKSLVHAADIGSAAKPISHYKTMVGLITEEFFIQGDREKARGNVVHPMCDRDANATAQSQTFFVNRYVQPLWNVIGNLLHPDVEDILTILENNHGYYKQQISN